MCGVNQHPGIIHLVLQMAGIEKGKVNRCHFIDHQVVQIILDCIIIFVLYKLRQCIHQFTQKQYTAIGKSEKPDRGQQHIVRAGGIRYQSVEQLLPQKQRQIRKQRRNQRKEHFQDKILFGCCKDDFRGISDIFQPFYTFTHEYLPHIFLPASGTSPHTCRFSASTVREFHVHAEYRYPTEEFHPPS